MKSPQNGWLALFAGLVACAGAGSAAAEGEIATDHFLSVPLVRSAPKIDGAAGGKEWASAAATTGFMRREDLLASTVQPEVQVAYDDAALYVAFISPLRQADQKTKALREGGGELQVLREEDTVDIFLQPNPPDGPWVHFHGGPTGGTGAKRDGKPYAAEFSYRSGVTEDRWTAEFAIPFGAMESESPAEGSVWGVNFWRRHAGSLGWTAWAPAQLFSDPRTFGRLHFGGDGPRARLTEMGNLPRADVDLQGAILAGEGRFVVSARAGRRHVKLGAGGAAKTWEEGPSGSAGAETSILEISGGSAPFGFQRKLEPHPSRVAWEITGEADGLLLLRHAVDFDPLPYFTLKVRPDPDAGTVRVQIHAAGMYEPGTALKGEISFAEGDSGEEILSGPAVFDAAAGKADFDLGALPVGAYRVTADVASDSGQRAKDSVEFKYSGLVPGEYATLGLEPEVPAPWTPVEVEGRQVGVWNRTITFNGSGLPESIRSAGREALARPITVRAYSGGKEMESTLGVGTVASVSRGSAKSGGSLKWEGLSIDTTCLTEFDGCMRVELNLSAGPDSGPDHLALEVPFSLDYADLMHAHALPGSHTSGTIPDGPGVVWHREFWPVIWLGNTHAGVCWFADSREGWILGDKGESAQEIVREDDAMVLRIHLAQASFPPGTKRRIVFGLHPTPVKPLPARWRRTRQVAQNPLLSEDPYWDTYVGDPAGKWWGWPTPKTDAEYARWQAARERGEINREAYSWENILDAREKVHAVGGRLTWYFPLQYISTQNPWYQTYGEPWALTGAAPIRRNDPWEAKAVCPAAAKWRDLYMGTIHHGMAKYDYDGTYIDLFIPYPCANPVHGCGYVDDNGRRQPEFTIWAMREQMKRLYRVVKARENGYVIDHVSMVLIPPLHAFVDTHVNGEHFWRHFALDGGTDYHDVLPLDVCRADLMGRQWGWIPLWLPMLKNPSLIPDWTASSRQMLSLVLLHDSLVLPAYMDGHEYHQANAILTRLGFIDAEFAGYFDTPPPATTDDPDVLASAYVRTGGKSGAAILLITNHSLEDKVARILMNAGRLELGAGDRKVLEHRSVETSTPLPVIGDGFTIEIPAKDFRIVSVEGGT